MRWLEMLPKSSAAAAQAARGNLLAAVLLAGMALVVLLLTAMGSLAAVAATPFATLFAGAVVLFLLALAAVHRETYHRLKAEGK